MCSKASLMQGSLELWSIFELCLTYMMPIYNYILTLFTLCAPLYNDNRITARPISSQLSCRRRKIRDFYTMIIIGQAQ